MHASPIIRDNTFHENLAPVLIKSSSCFRKKVIRSYSGTFNFSFATDLLVSQNNNVRRGNNSLQSMDGSARNPIYEQAVSHQQRVLEEQSGLVPFLCEGGTTWCSVRHKCGTSLSITRGSILSIVLNLSCIDIFSDWCYVLTTFLRL